MVTDMAATGVLQGGFRAVNRFRVVAMLLWGLMAGVLPDVNIGGRAVSRGGCRRTCEWQPACGRTKPAFTAAYWLVEDPLFFSSFPTASAIAPFATTGFEEARFG